MVYFLHWIFSIITITRHGSQYTHSHRHDMVWHDMARHETAAFIDISPLCKSTFPSERSKTIRCRRHRWYCCFFSRLFVIVVVFFFASFVGPVIGDLFVWLFLQHLNYGCFHFFVFFDFNLNHSLIFLHFIFFL